jgi:hypothetical protein
MWYAIIFAVGLGIGLFIGDRYGSRAITTAKRDLATLENDLRIGVSGVASGAADRIKAIAGKL